MTTSFGVPQVQALVECRWQAVGVDVPLIADGGIKRHGALAEALLFGGDCVMLGSAFAGTEEAPGEVVHKSVLLPESQKTVKVPFKVLRGMASIEAIRDRLDVEDADPSSLEALGAEGMEISVPARRLGAHDRSRHDQAPVLVDQLRRRRQPARAQGGVPEGPGTIRDPALVGGEAGVVREIRTRSTPNSQLVQLPTPKPHVQSPEPRAWSLVITPKRRDELHDERSGRFIRTAQ